MKLLAPTLLLLIPALVESATSPTFLSWRWTRNAPSLHNILFVNPGCPEVNIRTLAGGETESIVVVSYDGVQESDFQAFRNFKPRRTEEGGPGIDEEDLVDALAVRESCGRVSVVEIDDMEDLFDIDSWLFQKLIRQSTYTILTSLSPESIESLTGQPTAPLQSIVFSLAASAPASQKPESYWAIAERRLKKLLEGTTQGWVGVVVGSIWVLGVAAIWRRVRRMRREGSVVYAMLDLDSSDEELLERKWELTDKEGEKFIISIEEFE